MKSPSIRVNSGATVRFLSLSIKKEGKESPGIYRLETPVRLACHESKIIDCMEIQKEMKSEV